MCTVTKVICFPSMGIWELPSEPLCSTQTSRTSAVSVPDLHSCMEQLRHKFNLTQHPSTPSRSLCFFFSPPSPPPLCLSPPLPPLSPPSCLFHLLSFPLKGDYLLLTGWDWYFISKSLWLTVVFSTLLFLQCTERQTQQRVAETQWACWHIRGGRVWEAEASAALKWERTSLISKLKLPCSHLWPSLNSLTQTIHRPFSHTKKQVCLHGNMRTHAHAHTHTHTTEMQF